jgi:hypothetical protein
MRLNQTDGDLQVRLNVSPIDPHGHTAWTFAQKFVFIEGLTIVVLDPVFLNNRLANNLDKLIPQIGPMQTGRKEDCYSLAGDARLFQNRENLG